MKLIDQNSFSNAEQFLLIDAKEAVDDHQYFSKTLLDKILLLCLTIGGIVVALNILHAINLHLWLVVAVNVFIYSNLVLLHFTTFKQFSVRAVFTLLILYLIGLIAVLCFGPYGSGMIWLFVLVIFAGLLLGLKSMFIALAIIFFTFTIISVLIFFNLLDSLLISHYRFVEWIITSFSFLFLGALLGIVVSVAHKFINDVMVIAKKSDGQLKEEIGETGKLKIGIEEAKTANCNFISNLSNKIDAPLLAINRLAEMMNAEGVTAPEKDMYATLMAEKGTSLLQMFNDIIEFSKIQFGELVLQPNECFINKLIKDLYTVYCEKQTKMNLGHIELRIKVAIDNNDFIIITDSFRLRQILDKLLDNALKYTSNGFIEFGYILKTNKSLLFYVKDSGIGIPSEMQNSIFDSFVKYNHESAQTGTGIGLSIAKRLVEALQGSLLVESTPDKGTMFYFSIPTNYYSDLVIESPPVYKWDDKVVLIVEDDKNNLFLIKETLASTGIQILWASDGLQAVNIFTSRRIDIVLMDIMIPGINGYETTKIIRQFAPKTPIIAQTAYVFSEERQKALEVGCNDYITKPINPTILLSSMDKYLK